MFSNLRELILKENLLNKKIKRVIILDSIESTNSYAQSLENPSDSTVIIANNQTKGKGREGRQWNSFGDKNISMSIIISYPKTKDYLGLVSILSSNSVIQTLEGIEIEATVKWPNDVMVKSEKISGILSEATFKNNKSKSLIIGIGINANCDKNDFIKDDFEYRINPTSILIQRGFECSREEIIINLLVYFYRWLDFYRDENYEEILNFWTSRWEDRGKTVSIVSNGKKINGEIVDITRKGELILDIGGKKEILGSGEIFT